MICRGWGVAVDSAVGETISVNDAEGIGSSVVVGSGATSRVGVGVIATGWFRVDSVDAEAAGAHEARKKKRTKVIAANFFIINPCYFLRYLNDVSMASKLKEK